MWNKVKRAIGTPFDGRTATGLNRVACAGGAEARASDAHLAPAALARRARRWCAPSWNWHLESQINKVGFAFVDSAIDPQARLSGKQLGGLLQSHKVRAWYSFPGHCPPCAFPLIFPAAHGEQPTSERRRLRREPRKQNPREQGGMRCQQSGC